jgi:integrase/recombinase XerD
MLTIFKRHTRRCPHTSRSERRCSCPIAVEGTLNGEFIRKSLGLRSWEAAQKKIREWEVAGRVEAVVSVDEACEKFIAFCEAKHLAGATIKKYRLLAKELKREFGPLPVRRLTVDDMDTYRKSWGMSALSSRKKLERLRKFFKFCVEREWIHKNLALYLDQPKVSIKPTLPFTAQEVEDIIWATEVYRDDFTKCPRDYARRIKPLILVLRHTGLRISDAVSLEAERINEGKLFLYTQKTGVPVYIPLPESVVGALENVQHGRYFFWSGNGDLESATKAWQKTLKKLFEIAGVKGGHAHRFRDTFAVELLQKGVSIETVSVLLGHESIKTTQRHYNPWIQSRQAALEAAVMATWD